MIPTKLALRGALIFALVFAVFLYALFFLNQKNSQIQRRQYINTPYVTQPVPQSSQAIKVHNTLYISAQIGLKGKNLIDASMFSETEQAMENIHFLLQQAHFDFENVVNILFILKI